MNSFHRMLVHLTIGMMMVGMVSLAIAAPIPKGHSLMNSNGEGFDSIKQVSTGYSRDSSARGCRNRSLQGVDGYSMALNDFNQSDCSSLGGAETNWIYAPGCMNLGVGGNRMPSGHCSADDQLVTNFGNLVVRSSDQGLGRIDVPAQIFGNQNSLSSVVSVNHDDANSLNSLSSPIRMNQDLMAEAFRFDRMGLDLFDTDDAEGVNLGLDFDHQLVMTGKLAHLVPKAAQGARDLELGDLVFLLLFAILPEKKQITHLFRGIRRFKMF